MMLHAAAGRDNRLQSTADGRRAPRQPKQRPQCRIDCGFDRQQAGQDHRHQVAVRSEDVEVD
jgi:hypothetical protein